ncbi:MAG: hypothetical protein ABIB93_03350 [Chloroflexota bacterium]
MLLACLISGSVLLAYGLFSNLIIRFLFGSKYPLAAVYLKTYSLSMALLGFSHIMMRYFLSINQTKVSYMLITVTIVQITLMTLFHASISQMVNIMFVTSILCLLCQLPFHLSRKKKKEASRV